MVLSRHDITIDFGGANVVTLECEPFNWPKTLHERLELRITQETGWKDLDGAAKARLEAIFNGARGQVVEGLKGLLVQFVDGTGHTAKIVKDWRGNSGRFVFEPNDGLEIEEIHGSASESAPLSHAYHEGVLKLVPIQLY